MPIFVATKYIDCHLAVICELFYSSPCHVYVTLHPLLLAVTHETLEASRTCGHSKNLLCTSAMDSKKCKEILFIFHFNECTSICSS